MKNPKPDEPSGDCTRKPHRPLQASLVSYRERLRAERSRFSAMTTKVKAEITAAATTAARAGELLVETHGVLANCQASSLGPKPSRNGLPDPVAALREQRTLARLSDVLASTLDYENTLSQLVELIAENLGDIAVLYVCGADKIAHRVRAATRGPSTTWYCLQIQDIPGDAAPEHPVSRAIATKQPLLLEASASVLGSLAHSLEHAMALCSLELRSIMAVPLVVADRCVGALLLKSVSRMYGSDDLRFAQEVGQRTALLIENARLHQTARQAIEARDEMLGIVAHDLRNPLTAILLEASLLAIDGEDTEENVQESAAVIQDAAKFMQRLIEDLLDTERLRSGRLSVNRSRVAVASTITEFIRVQRPIVAAACLQLRVDVADDVSDVDADRDRLLQVLENLVANAKRFTSERGLITIGAKQRDADVLFWVSDTGSGIDGTELPRLFDRAAPARRIDRRGTGLGLPIVKGIVEAHGGRVWAESRVGEGTTIFFTLPAAF